MKKRDGSILLIVFPSRSISPSVISSRPAIILSNVDLEPTAKRPRDEANLGSEVAEKPPVQQSLGPDNPAKKHKPLQTNVDMSVATHPEEEPGESPVEETTTDDLWVFFGALTVFGGIIYAFRAA